MTDEPPVPEEVLTSALERLEAEQFSIADNETLLRSLSELTPIYEAERSYFVLGNYDTEQLRRLNLVVDRLNQREAAYAFLMNDVRGGWDNGIQKFCVIADLVTHVVGVAERISGRAGATYGYRGVLREDPRSQADVSRRRRGPPVRLDGGWRLRVVRDRESTPRVADRRRAARGRRGASVSESEEREER